MAQICVAVEILQIQKKDVHCRQENDGERQYSCC